MAENKKSFVLYADLLISIDHLTNEEKGILFNHLLLYVNDKKPVLNDRLILTAWKPIELQLKRDLIKFEDVKTKRSEAGKRSAELRALKHKEQNPTNPTSVESVEVCSTNPTVNVNDNDNDTVTQYSVEDFLSNWNELRTHFLKTPSHLNVLQFTEKNQFNDLKQSYTKEDFQTALKGLFKQERLPMPVMTLNPKHFLNNFYQYLDAENNKAYNLYKSN